jgi:hypothetical protein
MARFQNTLVAVRKYDFDVRKAEGSDLWAVGDAILNDKHGDRRRSPSGVKDGSRAALKECAKELASHGFTYSESWLRTLSRNAENFPPNRRHSDYSVHIHEEAGSPRILDWIVKNTPEDRRITVKYVRSMVKQLADDQAQKADKQAQAKGESPPPKPKRSEVEPPKDKESSSPRAMRTMDVLGLSREAKALAEKAKSSIEGVLDNLEPSQVRIITDHALAVVNAWQAVAELVRGNTANKRTHLSVVGE